MKNVILAAMAVLTLAGPASAGFITDWDYFWGTTVSQGLDPKINGWDDFWYQCQDPTKNTGDCIATVATGVGITVLAPVVAVSIAAGGAIIVGPSIGTALGIPFAGSLAAIGLG